MPTAEEIRFLTEVFNNTLQPDKVVIERAEQELNRLSSTKSDYPICVLHVVDEASVAVQIRQAAAVHFKNYVKTHWDPGESSDSAPIPDAIKGEIKDMVVKAMVSTPPEIRMQIGEALNLISINDFPDKWPELIPCLAQQLGLNDISISRGVLETANSVFKRFRNTYMSTQVSHDLEVSQKGMLKPLLSSLRFFNTQLSTQDKAHLEQVLECVRLIFRIFYSLNSFGMTEYMDADLKEWMRHLFSYLEFASPLMTDQNRETMNSIDAMKAAVCEILYLFIQINEDDFEQYVEQFVATVWKVLNGISLHPAQDPLVISAVNFLTGVAKGPYLQIFKQDNVLQQIFTAVIIPSLRLREDDIELFEINGIDYIRRDTEGSDSDTRRRAAADLVKALTDRFPNEISQLCTSYVGTLLEEYSKNPAENVLAKDCAIFMVVALAVKGKTASLGATTINAFVPLMQFWKEQIEPEILGANGINNAPLLKADALKFLTTFRMHIPRDIIMAVLPNVIALLRAENFVVHSYAATLIERLIVLYENKKPVFSPQDLLPFLQLLLENLFLAFELPDSSENPYLMKCVMRVVEFIGPGINSVAQQCLQALAQKLLEVCQNPQGPAFNHYLFESVAALVRSATDQGSVGLDKMQETLFPAFEIVLQKDVQEFHPYVFQILAEFIDLRSVPLPDVYLTVLPAALTQFLWERQGNVPALIKLLRAYLHKTPEIIVQQNHLQTILNIFHRLNSLKAHDDQGLLILRQIYQSVPLSTLESYQSSIWTLIFQRLQSSKTTKYVNSFLCFMSSVILKVGISPLAEVLEKIQSGITVMILEQIWVPSFPLINDASNKKICCAATIKILVEFAPLINRSPALWARLLEVLVNQLADPKSTTKDAVNPDMENDDFEGYTAAFAQLKNVKLSFESLDPGAERPSLLASLAALNGAMNNQLAPLVQNFVSPETVQKLNVFMNSGTN